MIHNPQLLEDIMRNLYWLTEAQMQRLRPYFLKSRSCARVNDLRVLSGIIFINSSGVHDVLGRWLDETSSGRFIKHERAAPIYAGAMHLTRIGRRRHRIIAGSAGVIWACSLGL